MGLDIDGAYLAAAQVSGGRVQNAASTPLEPGIVVDGEVADADRLVEALRDFVREHDLPRNVRLGVGNQQIAVRHLDLPKINDRAERETAVRFQAAEAMPMPLDDAVVDYSVVGEHTAEDGAPRERVVVVAARRPMISRYVDPVRRAGLKPRRHRPRRLRARARARRRRPTPRPWRASAATSAALANLAVAKGNVCLFTRPLSTPWHGESADARRAGRGDAHLDRLLPRPARVRAGRRDPALRRRRRGRGARASGSTSC